MRHILILFFCLFIGSLYGQIVRVDSTVIYESRSIYNQAGYYIGKDSFHVKQVRLAYCNDTFYERNDTLIQRFPQQFITSDSVDADITEVNVTNYLTGGGSSGAVTIGIDTSGTVGVATKYDVGTKIDGSGAYPFLARFTDSNTLASSVISDDGTGTVTIGNGDGGIAVNYSAGLELQNADEKQGVITSSGNGVIVGYNTYNDLTLINVDSNAYFIDLGGSGLSSIGTVVEGVYVNKIDASSTESNLLTIKDNGYIGIGGVTEPDATLHVDGTLKVTSQTGTPTKILGVDANGNVGEVGKGFGINVSGGDVLVDTTKIATQYDLNQVGGGSGDITEVTVTNYLTGGGTSGAVSIGMDTTGTVGVATKYDLKDFQTGTQVRDSIGTIDSNHDGVADNAAEATNSGKLDGQSASYYLNRANHTGSQDTSSITGLGEFVEDRAGAKIVAGTGITTSYNDATGETIINATGSGTGDITAVNVSGYLTGGGTSGDVTIGVDTTGTIGLATKYDLTTSSGTTNLTYSGTSSPITLNSSSGSDVTITAGTGISLTGTSGNMTINTTGLVSGTGTQYQIPRFSGTSSLEGVSGFTLNASNVLSVPNNLEVNCSGSSTTTPRIFGVTNMTGTTAARWTFGDALNSIQNHVGGRMTMQSWWGIEIMGSRQSFGALGFRNGNSNDPSLNVLSPASTRVVLAVTGESGQSGNLTEWRNSSNTVLSRISSAGNFIGSNQSIPVDLSASTGVLRLTLGTDAQRPAAATGQTRYNTTNNALEYSTASAWEIPLKATAATGLGTANKVFYADANGRATTGNLHWDNSANKLGVNSASPGNSLQVNGSLGRNAPTTTTGSIYSFTGESVTWLIVNASGTCTVTLPTASSYSGREITIKTITANTVISNASNVKPIDSDTAGTAILPATAGAWALLVSDGTNWIVMQKG